MGCGCNKGATGNAAAKLSWTVDLGGTGKTFADGTTKKVYATNAEAVSAISQAGATGMVRAKPSTN